MALLIAFSPWFVEILHHKSSNADLSLSLSPPLYLTEKDERRGYCFQNITQQLRAPFFQHEKKIPRTSDLMPFSFSLKFGLLTLQKDGGSRFRRPRTPSIGAECAGAPRGDADLLCWSQLCPTRKSFSRWKILPIAHTDALAFRYGFSFPCLSWSHGSKRSDVWTIWIYADLLLVSPLWWSASPLCLHWPTMNAMPCVVCIHFCSLYGPYVHSFIGCSKRRLHRPFSPLQTDAESQALSVCQLLCCWHLLDVKLRRISQIS